MDVVETEDEDEDENWTTDSIPVDYYGQSIIDVGGNSKVSNSLGTGSSKLREI
jgi:hypothetical protein